MGGQSPQWNVWNCLQFEYVSTKLKTNLMQYQYRLCPSLMFARIRVCSISVQMKSLWKEGFIELVRTMHTKEWNEPRSNHLFVIALMLHFAQYFFCTYVCSATVCYIHRMGYKWWNSNHARHFCRNFAKIWTIKSHSWKMHWKFCWATPMRQHSLPFRILTNSPKWQNDSKNAIIH